MTMNWTGWLTSSCCVLLAMVLVECGMCSLVIAQEAQKPVKAKGRSLTDRYPLKYPPTLADGRTSVVEESAEFLVPGPNLREGVQIAKTPPRVEFSFYPLQNYPGNPWSHRSDGFVRGDKYYSSSNDHLAPRGTAHLWEYDAAKREFRLLCDTTKFLESAGAFPESMNYRPGEMQSRIDLGSDGWLYYSTDRGSPTVTNDAHGYLGEWILRTHPETLATEIVATHPIPKHTIPASVLDPERMILYCGTAPGKDSPNQNVQFFALDLKSRKILKVSDGGPTRTLIFSPSTGRVFWEGKMYDPRTNEISPANVPHVRSCSPETPEGLVYGTSGTKSDLWSLNVRTGEVRQLGAAAVASQEYISSIEVDPTGRYLYYAPGAHGGATKDGTPIVQYDTRSGQRKVLAFLHERFWQQHGYALDGSFGNALDEKGERFFISWDGWRKGQPRGWESASITVLHIPASERVVDSPSASTTFSARQMVESGVTQNVRLAAEGRAIELEQGLLIEDDGPAAGYSYQPNEEILSEDVRIKKDLWIERPAARQATLLVGWRPAKNAPPLEAHINGHAARLEAAGREGRYFEAYRFDPKLLVSGKNEIVLRGAGKIWIARDDEYAAGSRERTRHPNRSAKSTDGGQTWDYERLGTRGDVDGEYYVRLFLDQSLPQGTITLPVVDVGNLSERPVPAAVTAIGPVKIRATGEGVIRVRARSGATYVPKSNTWSEWYDLSQPGSIERPTGRYVQVAVELIAEDPLASARLKDVTIEAGAAGASDWTAGLRVIESENRPIVRSSIPFEYEPWDHSDLRTLRERYKLDDVAKGAKSEFETICRLAIWSSQRWEKGHLAESYPAWNALEILSSHKDGKPVGGFCQQYNLVFLQACESFGIPGRAVSIDQGRLSDRIKGSGHEVVEIWSNDHRKWVYVDGNCAWYAVDQPSGVPLSLLELRERQLDALDGKEGRPIRIEKLAATRYTWDKITSWPPFEELRLIPRSNFLAERSPLPLNQGMSGWFWTGHHVWTDDRLRAGLLYGNRVPNRPNFEWTLNQAHYVLEATSTPGQVRVHLDTVTPGLETLMARIDDAPAQPVEDGFLWTLHAGRNRLEVYPRNRAGREGIASWLVLDWE